MRLSNHLIQDINEYAVKDHLKSFDQLSFRLSKKEIDVIDIIEKIKFYNIA